MEFKSLINYTLLCVLLLSVVQCQSQEKSKDKETDVMVYKDVEAEIPFPGSFIEAENGGFSSITNDSYVSGYFFNVEKEIRYYPDEQPVYEETETGELIPLQRAISSDGYLSSMFVLPPIDENKLIEEINRAFKPEKSAILYRDVVKRQIDKQLVYNWRVQKLKTRLEHYLVIGKKHNYLFISSPYGEQDYIESIIKKMTIKRE